MIYIYNIYIEYVDSCRPANCVGAGAQHVFLGDDETTLICML